MLEELRKIAVRFQIDPIATVGHAAKLETVLKVLSEVNKSYKNFLSIEFFKNDQFAVAFSKNDKILDSFIEELELLIVDVKFDSFAPAIAPNLLDNHAVIFSNEVEAWKKEKFDSFKEDIIKADFSNPSYIKWASNRYTEDERTKIFQPLFSSFGDGKKYKLNLQNENFFTVKTLIPPEKKKLPFYITKIEKVKEEPEFQTVQVYAKIKKEPGEINFKKRSIEKILYLEELEFEIYPYKPKTIQYMDKIYVLSEKLDCVVSYEAGDYIIKNDKFDLTVWGETRDQAEESFSFAFNALYENYALEDDNNLSDEAQVLKVKLNAIVKNIVNSDENKKN